MVEGFRSPVHGLVLLLAAGVGGCAEQSQTRTGLIWQVWDRLAPGGLAVIGQPAVPLPARDPIGDGGDIEDEAWADADAGDEDVGDEDDEDEDDEEVGHEDDEHVGDEDDESDESDEDECSCEEDVQVDAAIGGPSPPKGERGAG
jgi:hypothetical protein